jgi:hypothetical protein
VRRHLDDQRAVLRVEPAEGVDGLGVRREEQRARVQQRLGDQHRLVVGAEGPHARAHRAERRRRQGGEERLHAALEVEVVVDLLDGRLVGQAVEEAQRAQPRLDAVGGGDGGGDVGGHLAHVLATTFASAEQPSCLAAYSASAALAEPLRGTERALLPFPARIRTLD